MAPGQYASFNQTTIGIGGPEGLASKATLNDQNLMDNNVRADVHVVANSPLTKKLRIHPTPKGLPMTSRCCSKDHH